MFFAKDVESHEQEDNRQPDIIGNPSGVVDLQVGRQILGKKKMEVAQLQKQVSEPLGNPDGCKLVKGQWGFQQEKNNTESDKSEYMEKNHENLLCIVCQEIADQYAQNPGNGDKRSGLRGISCSLGEQRGIQHIGCGQAKYQEKMAEISSRHFDASQKGKEINRGIKEKSVPLVEKISGERFPSVPEGNISYDGFEVFQGFLWCHCSFPADSSQGKRAIKSVLEYKVEKCQERGKDEKVQDIPARFEFFKQNPNGIDEKGANDENVFDRVKPDEAGEK